MTTKSEIQSMLFLLEDPDPFIKQEVLNRFYQLGDSAVPLLDECRVETASEDSKKIAANLLFDLTFPGLYQDFFELYSEGLSTFAHLERAILYLTRFDDPTFRTSVVKQKMDNMARFIASDIQYALDPNEQMNRLLTFVFQDEGFDGVGDDLFKPENSYMNRVLENKRGIPLSLAMVVLSLADRLELPFFGVNMPMHFILMFECEQEITYIDPYQHGKFLTKKECDYFLKINGVESRPEYFQKATYSQMLVRTMRNLQYSFEKQQDVTKAVKLKMLIELHEQFYKD
ncbi:hypothetical protein EP331_04015 [bacterium]|nr:MAG: hypothetical protein EP331_04015 [bacterium]